MTKTRFGTVILTALFTIGTLPVYSVLSTDSDSECLDLRVAFARGSGGPIEGDSNFEVFKAALEPKLQTTNLKYEIFNMPYPAVGIGLDHLDVSLGALIGSGDAYEFGASVAEGAEMFAEIVNDRTCPNTKYVIAGYSQGAMTVSKSLSLLDPENLIYAASFGDPKIYLPEGEGVFPDACQNRNLSDYRAYVPDCYTYIGLLGTYDPYVPEGLEGKVGTWCNGYDIFCSSGISIKDHMDYIDNNLYEDASRVIFSKITEAFDLENKITSPHDTAILVDSSSSMSRMIFYAKNEALKLAQETLESGGRIALYEYRDLLDPFEPIEHCNFEDCTLEKFTEEINSIELDGGGDEPESLLSASLHVMKKLKWQYGATKSLVVLTDANYLLPDRDGTTLEQVIALSRSIDPVNFYVITIPDNEENYKTLVTETDGAIITDTTTLNTLTDTIMERFDSLPRVETISEPQVKPSLTISDYKIISDTSVQINFTSDASKFLISVNDAILGITDAQNSIILEQLNLTTNNTITLVPLTDTARGTGQSITIETITTDSPWAPNTGSI